MSLTDCLFGCKYSCLTFIFALNVRVKSYVMQKRRTTLTDIIKSPHVFIWRLLSHLVYPLLFLNLIKHSTCSRSQQIYRRVTKQTLLSSTMQLLRIIGFVGVWRRMERHSLVYTSVQLFAWCITDYVDYQQR